MKCAECLTLCFPSAQGMSEVLLLVAVLYVLFIAPPLIRPCGLKVYIYVSSYQFWEVSSDQGDLWLRVSSLVTPDLLFVVL